MDLIDYEKHVRSEASARKLLLSHCWRKGERFCPRCRTGKIYDLSDARMRCAACRYTFHDLSGRWVNMGGLTAQDWLRVIKLFELDLTTRRMTSQVRLSYNTVYKAVTILRFSILGAALDASQLLGGELGRAMGFEAGKLSMTRQDARLATIPVFGLIEKNGWAFIDLLPHMRAEDVLHFNLNFSLKLTRMGKIVYTDRYQRYDALVFCGDEGLGRRFVEAEDRTAYVDSRRGSFWNFARARLRRYNGVTSRRFPLYLKELEFRYNHRDEDIYPILLANLCSLVPRFQ